MFRAATVVRRALANVLWVHVTLGEWKQLSSNWIPGSRPGAALQVQGWKRYGKVKAETFNRALFKFPALNLRSHIQPLPRNPYSGSLFPFLKKPFKL